MGIHGLVPEKIYPINNTTSTPNNTKSTHHKSTLNPDLPYNQLPYKRFLLCLPGVAVLRSIRIEGKTEKVSEAKSAEYFDSRPVGSRIGAAVSVRQSEVVASREVLTVS